MSAESSTTEREAVSLRALAQGVEDAKRARVQLRDALDTIEHLATDLDLERVAELARNARADMTRTRMDVGQIESLLIGHLSNRIHYPT